MGKENLENNEYFRWKIAKGCINKNIPDTPEYNDRLKYEIETIEKLGFVDYMLIIADLLDFAEKVGINRGPGRGSVSGSLIAFVLNITTIDPIKYGLYFERFLNPDRVSNPDIDLDFSSARRHEVFEYIQKRYGEENVASIATFGKMWSRAIIRNVGSSLGMDTGPGTDVDKIAKLFPSLEREFGECIEEVEELQKYQKKYPELFEKSKYLSGKPKSVGVHAAGTIITPMPIEKIFPMGRGSAGKTAVTQWDMYDVEETGFVKIDLLGLNTLDVIDRTVKLVKARYGVDIDIEKIDMEDKLTINLFRNGKTNGLFQLERKYVQDLCKKIDIHRFEEICDINALIRPGTLHSGMTKEYVKRKTGEEEYICPHESLRECLADTYGVLLYQETIMRCVRDYAGFTMSEADTLRKIIGKKKIDQIDAVRQEFYKKANELGRPEDATQELWRQIDTAKNYLFNKSHACAYGKITFQAAWLKSHYFLEFMTELLNGEANSNEPKLDSYLRECRLNGIGILPPSAKKANESFEIEGKKNIRFGLCFIKKVTDRSVLALRKNAAYLGSFTNLIINDESGALKKDVMTNLILVGAFDYMGENRACLLEKYLLIKDLIDDYCTQQKKKKEGVKIRKEYSMEFILEQEMNFEFKGREMTSEDCTAKEHELCSCYIVNDPLTPFEELIEDESYRDIMDIEDGRYDKSKPIKLIAVLKTMNIHVMTKGKNAGKEMCFIDVFDTFKEMSCVIFSETFEKVKEKLAPNAVYTFIGKYDGESFVVNDVELLLK